MAAKPNLITSDLKTKLRLAGMANRGIRAYEPKRRRTRLAGPLLVQVQTIDRCNASCVMCPYSASEKSGRPSHIDPEAYGKILDELAHAGTVRSFTPMLQNEPLLDRNIADSVRKARNALADSATVFIVTNGALLTAERVDTLLEAGTNSISVSIDAFREETYRSIRKGLDFSRVVGNVQSLLRREARPQVSVRFLKQRINEGEDRLFARYWKAQGADVFLHSVLNRAGTLGSFDQIDGAEPGPSRRLVHRLLHMILPFCPLPFYSLNILCDGRVILCCHDWGPSTIVGNLRKESLPDVWNGELMNHYRHLIYSGRTGEIPSCSNCSYRNGAWRAKTR